MNNDNPNLFGQLVLLMAAMSGQFIIGGDLQPELDKSTGVDASNSQTRKELLQCMKEFNLVDVWRVKQVNLQTVLSIQ